MSKPQIFEQDKIDFSHMREQKDKEKLQHALAFSFPKRKIPEYLKSDFPDKRMMKVKEYISWLEKSSGNPSVDWFNEELEKFMREKKYWVKSKWRLRSQNSHNTIWKDPLLIAWENYKLLFG